MQLPVVNHPEYVAKINDNSVFPIKKFRLVGKINKGKFEKISAKSDFSDDEHLDISLKKQLNSKQNPNNLQ